MYARLRRRRLRTRLSLMAIGALLWAQVLMAWHGDCAPLTMSGAPAVAAAHQHDDCSSPRRSVDDVVCLSHCSQGDGSPEAPRAPLTVPTLAASQETWTAPLASPVEARGRHDPFPTAALSHRPTSHPAGILLI